jgi:branched-chain amino acid transport system permease protein
MTKRVALLILVGVLIVVPAFANLYLATFLTRIAIYAIFAVSLDFILGYGGLVSLGHAAFFGAGAYCTAILILNGVTDAGIGLAAAACSAGLLALAIGVMAVRVKGIYFIMLTFAFAQMIFYLAIGQAQWGGDDGMTLPTHLRLGRWIDLGEPRTLFYVAFLLLALVIFFFHRVTHSSFGLALEGCRQDEIRMRTLGFRVNLIRLAAFALAGVGAGIAGFVSANLEAYLSPSLLDWRISAIGMMIVVIGGVRTLYGAVLGAAFYLTAEELTSRYTDHWMAIFGLLLVAVALIWSGGLYPTIRRLFVGTQTPTSLLAKARANVVG